jgi:hypothetical protein
MANPTPEAGQVWRDNDTRSYGSGEFEIVSVDDVHVIVKRQTGRNTRIRKDRLSDESKRGYTYVGKAR